MKKKSFFSQIILLIILALFCIASTIILALLAGTIKQSLFDFKNLNLENTLPILFIGGFVSCIIIGIAILFLSRSIFFKIKDYFTQKNTDKEE